MEKLPQIAFTRQAMLLAWLKQEGITQARIAQALETSEQSVSRWMRAESLSSRRHEQLVKFGIPAELLPPAIDICPGPKRARTFPAPPQVAEMRAS